MHSKSINSVRELIRNKLLQLYEKNEADSITWWILEDVCRTSKAMLLARQNDVLNYVQYEKLQQYLLELMTAKPVQYVVGYTYFRDLKLFVNENTLIPRSETEELVEVVLDKFSGVNHKVHGLDIGTGSGCIPVAIVKENPVIHMDAVDKYADAVSVAKSNADTYNTRTNFIVDDILDADLTKYATAYDFIVSNPPYVLDSDKKKMQNNVLDFEPASALYVPDEDALRFYNVIADFSRKILKPSGFLFLEIHEEKGEEISDLLIKNGFTDVVIKKDLYGKDRIAIAKKR